MKHLISIIFLSIFVISIGKAQTVNFNGATVYPSGTNTRDIATGDFNKDGFIDIAVCNNTSPGKVAILLANGTGGYAAPVLYNAGTACYYLKKIDLNKDGNLDLLVVNTSTTAGISVLLGDGMGAFAAPVFYATGNNAADAAFGDFNKDGNIDAVVPNDGVDNVSLLVGNGAGGFATAVNFATNYNPEAIDTADFNEDGNLDIAVAGYYGFNLLLGNGAASFGTYSFIFITFSQTAYSIETADFENDGNMDVMIGGGYGLYYFKGKGDGTFFPFVYTQIPGSIVDLNATDLNNDGFLDIVCSSGDMVYRYLNKGDGTIGTPQAYSSGNGFTGMDVVDLNNDGLEDIATANLQGGNVSVLYGKADATLKAATTFHSIEEGRTVATADFNNDANPDILYATGSSYYFYPGNGDGTFSDTIYTSSADAASGITTGDFNEDGFTDFVVTGSQYGSIKVRINNTTGGFNAGVNYTIGTNFYPYTVVCGYLNADNHLDLVTANNKSTGTVSVLYGIGDGTFTTAVELLAGMTPRSVIINDFNEDGKNDILVTNSNGISVLINNGSGFNTRVNYTASNAYGVAAADFDGDNHLDLILANRSSAGFGALSFMKGNGTGGFAAVVNYLAGPYPQSVIAGHFNQDAYIDAAIYSDEGLVFFLNNGSGIFTLAGKLAAGSRDEEYTTPAKYPTLLAIADFNKDGNTDVVTANTSWAGISVFINLNSPALSTEPTTPSSGMNFSSINPTGVNLSWTNGDGTNRIVILKAGSPVDQLPSDATAYTANAAFGSGTELGSGNFVVYNVSGNSITVTGLDPATVYYIAVIEYNGSGVTTNYLTSSYLQSSITTTTVAPTTPSSGINFSSITTNGFDLSWTNGNGANRIVILKATSAVNQFPVDATTYTSDATFGSGANLGSGNFVVYNGSDNSVTVTGLNPATVYNAAVIEYNGSGATINYLTSSYLQGNVTTTSVQTGTTSASMISDIKLYPNPMHTNSTLILPYVLSGEFTVTIYDMHGNEQAAKTEKNTDRIQLNRSGLINGMYFYKLYYQNEIKATGKLIVF